MIRESRSYAAMALLALTACAPGSSDDNSGGVENGQSDIDNAFVESYRRSYTASCADSAVNRGVERTVAENACTCMADALIRDLSMAELMNPSDEQFAAAASECAANLEQSDG